MVLCDCFALRRDIVLSDVWFFYGVRCYGTCGTEDGYGTMGRVVLRWGMALPGGVVRGVQSDDPGQ
eukprot:1491180-Rhodomonas_salina.3